MKLLLSLIAIFCSSLVEAQVDSVEKIYGFKITAYIRSLTDTSTVVQVIKPASVPVIINEKQVAVLYHSYKAGVAPDTAMVGWGKCQLIKGEYYYFSIQHSQQNKPVEADMLYLQLKLPYVYKGLLLDVMSHALVFTDVYEKPFMNPNSIFTNTKQAEHAILDSMVADIRFTADAMKEEMAEQNLEIASGLFKGKKLFDAMEAISRNDLELFLKYVIARPKFYAGNTWKISETFATWMNAGAPTAIEK